MLIRPACPGDFPAIALVAQAAWRDTYTSTPASVQAQMMEHFYSPEALRRALHRPGSQFLVAVLDGEVVGFAAFVVAEPSVVELSRLYVLPSFQGRGIGTALLNRGEGRLPPDTRTLRVAVDSENQRARRFYERRGFGPCGENVVPAAGHLFRLTLYSRRCAKGEFDGKLV